MGKKRYYKRRRELPKDGYLGALLRMLPVVLMVGFVPLIVRQYQYETKLMQYAWFGSKEIDYEFFLASKSTVLMLLLFVMAGCILMRFWKEKRKIPFLKILIPLFVYGIFALLSACCSVNPGFSFSGGYEHFETIWVLLSYVLVVYYVFLYAQTEMELQVVADAICFGATVIGILGTLQGLGFDFLANGVVQKLVTTDWFLNAIGGRLLLNFPDNHALATLYNPNYMGVYGSFVLPFLTMLLLFEKDKWRRIWHLADFVLLAVALLSSRSRAGLIAAVLALCVAVVLCAKKMVKLWYLTIPAINFGIVLLLLVNAYNDNLIFDRLQGIFMPDTKAEVAEFVAEDGTVVRETGLTELYTTEDGVVLRYNEVAAKVSLYVEGEMYGFYAFGEDDEQIEMVPDEEAVFSLQHPALSDVKIQLYPLEDRVAFLIQADGPWLFTNNQVKGKYQYVVLYGEEGEWVIKETDMTPGKQIGFKNRQKMFSGRGHIWSRTIPLLLDHIFIGSGPDTFLLEYPHTDFLAMKQNGFERQIMTKPHSMYLQVGVQTGVVSLLCILVFYVWYAVWSIRLYAFRKLENVAEGFGIAAFIGSIGYMISGISNDSMVVTAPVFWGMIGLGIAANAMVDKLRKKKEA